MPPAKPSVEAFANAIRRLESIPERYQSDPSDHHIRDGLVKNFEFTYDSAHKLLRRYLAYASPSAEEVMRMTFPTLIRTANENGLLLGDWPNWKGYRDMRNKTSHTYKEAIALEVAGKIPGFLEEALWLRDQLQGKLA